MSKKTLRLLVVVMTLVCIVALLFAFAACNKTGGGDDNNGDDNNNGNNGGNNNLFDQIVLQITPKVKQVSFSTSEGQYEVITDNTYYYAQAMQQTLERGNFQFVIDMAYMLHVDGQTLDQSTEIKLTTSEIGPSSLLSYKLTKNIGKTVSFTLSDLYSDSVAGNIHRDLVKLGLSTEDADKFTNYSADTLDTGRPKYAINLCYYMGGYDAESEKVDIVVPQIVSIDKPIVGRTFDLDPRNTLDFVMGGDVKPYDSVDADIFNRVGDMSRSLIEEDLSSDRNAFVYSRYGHSQFDFDITAEDFDSDCTIKDGKIVLDKNEISFSVVIGYRKYTFTAQIGEYFAEKYRRDGLTIKAEKVKERYDFEGTHSQNIKTRIEVFGQTGDFVVTKSSFGFSDGYVGEAYNLPVFFADKIGNCTLSYIVDDGEPSEVISYEKEAPDNVKLSVVESDAGEFGLYRVRLTFVYDGLYETTSSVKYLLEGDRSDPVRLALVGMVYDERFLFKTVTVNGRDFYGLDPDRITKASDTPYEYRNVAFSIDNKNYSLDFSVTINKVAVSYTVDGRLSSSYWQYDNINFGNATNFVINYNVGVYSNEYESVNVPLTASMFPSFSTEEVVSEGRQYVVNLNGKDYALDATCGKYTVKQNPVVSIELASDALDGFYVKDEPFEFEPFRATVTFKSGLVRIIDVTEDMLSGYDESAAGTQTVTVTYKEGTATKDILVKEVSSLEFYDKNSISDTYLLNETPAELEIKVTFTDGDYDVIALTEQQIRDNFDTSSVGSGKFSFTYGGKNISKTFKVVEAAYLYYNVDETTGEADIIGLGYDKTERAYKLTSCSEIEIPSKIGEYTVVSIGAQAFMSANGIKGIVVPETVTEISGSAFSKCTGLKKLVIKGNPTVGSSVIGGCTNLEYLEIPAEAKTNLLLWFQSSVSDSKTYALPATNLTVKFSEGSETIPDNFFNRISEDTPVQKLVLPRSLTSIGDQSNSFEKVVAFEAVQGGSFSVVDGVLFSDEGTTLCYYPVHLKNETLVIGDSVVKVGGIMNNPYLKTVVIGQNVAELSENIFTDCTALESVTFRGSLKVIPNWAFARCSALTAFTFPEGLETIGDDAFIHSGLLELIIPDSVTSVGNSAFYSVPVKRIYIPAHLTDFFDKDKGHYDLCWGYFRALEAIAYSGSIPLKKLTVYSYDGAKFSLQKVYVTETICENFAYGIDTQWPLTGVYALEKVTSVGAGATYDSSKIVYSERSSGITNNSYAKITYNQTFDHWWEK